MTQSHEDARNPNADLPRIHHLPAGALIRQALSCASAVGLRIVGPPGSGKTELIVQTLRRLSAPRRVAVVVVNPAPARDVQRLRDLCGFVTAIEGAIPKASLIWPIVTKLDLHKFDTVLIETAGGLAPLQDLGQDATVAVFAVSGGDDKAAEYHKLLVASSAVLLTKTDLQSLVNFDSNVFRKDVRSINPSTEIHALSASTGDGIHEWISWIEKLNFTKRHRREDLVDHTSDDFLG